MANMKKTILPDEWEVIKKQAQDPACSLSRLFDILRSERARKNIQLLNRSWFLAFMMNVCGAKDGKIGTKFRIPVSAEKTIPEQVEEAVTKKLEEVPSVNQPSDTTESVSDLLSEKALFALKWMYSNNAKSFAELWLKGGYSKKICTDVSSELLSLGVVTKKGPKRFEPFDWTQILKDFPEVAQIPEEHPEWKAKQRLPKTAEEEVEVSAIDRKMDSWLLEEKHTGNEITSNEVIDELRRIRSTNPLQDSRNLIDRWIKEEKIRKVAYTSAYAITSIPLPMSSSTTPKTHPPEHYADHMRKILGYDPPRSQVTTPPQQTTAKALVVHLQGNKDIEIRNNSMSKLKLVVENDRVILNIED